jgi:SAM-dependent methyltransferase
MASTTQVTEKAERWGRRWGSWPQDWMKIEEQQVPTYEGAIRRLGIEPGGRVLDLGCGTGVFLRLAADRGAEVFGLDASEALLELARNRVPGADLRVGDMQFLPYEDDFFDLVTGFNSFFFAADMVAALREARRVAKPASPVVIQVWGRPDHCDLTAMKPLVAPFMPPPEPGAPSPPPLWQPGVLEGIAGQAGLAPESAFDVSYAFEYSDDDAVADGILSAGGVGAAAGDREEKLRASLLEALAPYRTPSGGYRLENEWRYLVARAG